MALIREQFGRHVPVERISGITPAQNEIPLSAVVIPDKAQTLGTPGGARLMAYAMHGLVSGFTHNVAQGLAGGLPGHLDNGQIRPREEKIVGTHTRILIAPVWVQTWNHKRCSNKDNPVNTLYSFAIKDKTNARGEMELHASIRVIATAAVGGRAFNHAPKHLGKLYDLGKAQVDKDGGLSFNTAKFDADFARECDHVKSTAARRLATPARIY